MGIKTGISKWRFGLLLACGLSLVCGGLVGWYGIEARTVNSEVVMDVECVGEAANEQKTANEQIEILKAKNDVLQLELSRAKDQLEQMVDEVKYERLISERLKLAVLQSWSDRFDIEQAIHQQDNN